MSIQGCSSVCKWPVSPEPHQYTAACNATVSQPADIIYILAVNRLSLPASKTTAPSPAAAAALCAFLCLLHSPYNLPSANKMQLLPITPVSVCTGPYRDTGYKWYLVLTQSFAAMAQIISPLLPLWSSVMTGHYGHQLRQPAPSCKGLAILHTNALTLCNLKHKKAARVSLPRLFS